ncbi:MAG: single-stranded DNA-binding protein [candidate division KSB1 bacterium]|nr:single-stranded DNA-binding protein [candidate division KSB1 bacterium]MDZ7305257.1 single-stranded DNA-binding protein [candidate division KSB1 bacterium]MDZ7312041.1 single-stranded DNA-binding protein [candidate division KSB1 bacterium]
MATRGLNKVMLIGHLGGDPELKYTPGGQAVATFSVATNEVYKDKEGNPQERAEWHRIVAWNRLAEVAAEYLKKGQQVYVEGRLQTRSWNDKDGVKRYITEIVANTFQFLGRKAEGAGVAPEIPVPTDDLAPPPQESREDLPF